MRCESIFYKLLTKTIIDQDSTTEEPMNVEIATGSVICYHVVNEWLSTVTTGIKKKTTVVMAGRFTNFNRRLKTKIN